MTFTATCLHCDHAVVVQTPQIGVAEVRALQNHLLTRCRRDEAVDRVSHLSDLLRHFRVTTTDE